MSSKYAAAYLFPDRLVVHGQVQTDYGSFARGPFQRLDRSAPPDEIGHCLRAALDSFRKQSEMPNVKETLKAFLDGLGVKSNAQLQRAALCVNILEAAEIEFHPTHNGGTSGDRKGFQPIAGVAPLHIPADAPASEIARALMDAFALCTTIYAR